MKIDPDEAKTQPSVLPTELEVPGAPKRGCLKSADFYIAPDFDASGTGFEEIHP